MIGYSLIGHPPAALPAESAIHPHLAKRLLALCSMLLIASLWACRDDAPQPPSFGCPDPDALPDDDDSAAANDDDDSSPSAPPNSAPTAPSVLLLPADAGEHDDLHCLLAEVATDADADPLTYRFSWLADGVPIAGGRSLVPSAETTFGTEWTCEVVANDGKAEGTPGSATLTIGSGNSPPTAPGLIIEPSMAEAEAPLYCLIDQASEDADGDEIYYSYHWELNEVPTAHTTSMIDGSLVLDQDCWTCVVVPYDHTSVGPTTADTVCIMSGPAPEPTAPTVEIIIDADGSLECVITVASELPGDPAAIITYLFSWLLNGFSTTVNISEVDAALTNPNEVWTCSATPFDGVRFGESGDDEVTIPAE